MKIKKIRNRVKQFWEPGDKARRLILGKQETRKGTQSQRRGEHRVRTGSARRGRTVRLARHHLRFRPGLKG